MTTPESYPAGVDPMHVRAICMAAAPGTRREGIVVLAGRGDGVRVYLTHRAEATAARAALRRVGYEADRADGRRLSSGLIVTGWSADRLEARLTAMRTLVQRLAADPRSTAADVLDRLGRQPSAPPSTAGQQELVIAARHQLREWIMATSGIHARCDPRARPADIGVALRLSASWQAETAIDELAARHLRIAVHAVALYPELRHQESHHSARDLAIHRAEIAVSGSPGSAWRSATRPRYVRQPSAGQATRPVVASFPILPLSAGLATEPQLQAPGRRESGLPSPRTGRQR